METISIMTENGKSRQSGHVISDLHMFSNRSVVEDHLHLVHRAAEQSEFFVLNGDTFDFDWAVHEKLEHAVDEAIEWVELLASRYPTCHFHIVLGNHDYVREFVVALEALVAITENLSLHPFYVRLGDSLFLHGDASDGRMGARELARRREAWIEHRQRHSALHQLYDWVTQTGLHRAVYFIKPRRLLAHRIEHYLRDVEAEEHHSIDHVYFGHTHVPFTDHRHQGKTYHNTGSTIRGLNFNMLRIEISE